METRAGANPLQEFVNKKFKEAFGDSTDKKLVVAKGIIKGTERELLCLQNKDEHLSPVSILPYLTDVKLYNDNIPLEEIMWTADVKPIKLQEAVERGLISKDVERGLQEITAASMRLDGKKQDEIVLALADMKDQLSSLKK